MGSALARLAASLYTGLTIHRERMMAEPDKENWREIAEKASKEADPDKLLDLARELQRALDDHQVSKKNPDSHRVDSPGRKVG